MRINIYIEDKAANRLFSFSFHCLKMEGGVWVGAGVVNGWCRWLGTGWCWSVTGTLPSAISMSCKQMLASTSNQLPTSYFDLPFHSSLNASFISK